MRASSWRRLQATRKSSWVGKDSRCGPSYSGPRTVSSKQVIQQVDEVLRLDPVECGPHFWKHPEAKPAFSTALFIASSAQAFETRLTTSATCLPRQFQPAHQRPDGNDERCTRNEPSAHQAVHQKPGGNDEGCTRNEPSAYQAVP
jgi:hypothetical protein